MIPRLGDGNLCKILNQSYQQIGLENDSPSRGRKPVSAPMSQKSDGV